MIFISAGHYPQAPGAGFEDFYEHDEAMLWATIIQGLIEMSSDLVPTGVLREKLQYINNRSNGDDLALEIHFNAAKDSGGKNVGRGCETLYYPASEKGRALATIINDAMARHFKPNRGVKEGYYRMNPDNGPDFFLARTHCPAVIIEPDFIHRKALIQDGRQDCCASIAEALLVANEEIFK